MRRTACEEGEEPASVVPLPCEGHGQRRVKILTWIEREVWGAMGVIILGPGREEEKPGKRSSDSPWEGCGDTGRKIR